MLRLINSLALAATLLAGCSDFPELDAAITSAARNADYPNLLPIDQLIADAQQVQISPETVTNLEGRISHLNARAARLRGPVIDGASRARMRAAIARHR
ncbi:hypothetical protein [Profundibacter sp.]